MSNATDLRDEAFDLLVHEQIDKKIARANNKACVRQLAMEIGFRQILPESIPYRLPCPRKEAEARSIMDGDPDAIEWLHDHPEGADHE